MLKDESWLPMAAIALAHAGLLGVALNLGQQGTMLVTQPVMTGVLVAPSTAVRPPKPLPAAPQPQKPLPTVRPKPIPLPVAPPSERAITISQAPPEPVAPPTESVAVAAPAPSAPPAPSPIPGPAPVIPPRSDASHLNNPAPTYPAMSRRLAEQGRVLFDVYILPNGTVGEIKLKRSSGHTRLDDAALEAVRRWRYVPAHRGNEPIPYWYVQPITFSLDN